MFSPRDVIRAASVQVAIGVGLLVQPVGFPPAQQLRDHPLVLRFGPVAVHHALRLRQLRRFINPGFQWSCQTDLPAGPAFRRHIDQTAPPRSLAPPTALGTEGSDRAEVLERMDSAVPAAPSKDGAFVQAGTLFISTCPQSMLPLAAHASRLPGGVAFRRALALAWLFLISLLH